MERLLNMATFAQVVESQGFSAAAERLQVSRAVVSKRIAALERDLGVTLLHRTTRRQSLTEAGEALYAHSRRVLDEVATAEERVHELSSAPRGILRVTAPKSYGSRVLGPRIAQFLMQFPQIRMDLQLSDELTDLAARSVDLAVRLTAKPAEGLVARRLEEIPAVLCAAPAYVEKHGAPARPEDLLAHNCLYYAGDLVQRPWRLSREGRETAVDISGSLWANSVAVLRDAAIAGLGVVAISRYHIEEDLAAGALVELLPEYTLPLRNVYLVTLPDRLLPTKTRVFIDFLTQAIRH
ncbi:LysR family transcriptional regulator [Niveibacterium sp. SC-1]|uniref:LysR family transcriptional regulator n=1 Tax=Niveibacterium sp. SC-1 TaxID=3135646 RepID=UPI00311EB763